MTNQRETAPVTVPRDKIVTNRNPYLCVVIVAALTMIGSIATVGLVLASLWRVPVPESLVAVAATAVGALAGSLAVSGQIRTLTQNIGGPHA